MKGVFLDASVLVAACASTEGASALILGFCRKKQLTGYVSSDVVGEARKNVVMKLPPVGLARLEQYLHHAHLVTVPDPGAERIAVAELIIHVKDSPIFAAALTSPASVIVSLDKKHFFTKEVISFAKPKKILLPGDFVRRVDRGGL